MRRLICAFAAAFLLGPAGPAVAAVRHPEAPARALKQPPKAQPAAWPPAAARPAPGGSRGRASSARWARVPVTVPALLARSRPAQGGKLLLPAIEMEHVTSHARHVLRPDLRGGGFSPRQMRSLMDFLRCHHTNKRRPMDPRLVQLIYATARHYNNAKVYVIAGYRAPQIAEQKGNPNSPHKRGVATDFRLEGVPLESLRDYLRRAYSHVGVGYYPNSGFVHLDVGRKQSAYWVDYSGPGERARYAKNGESEAEPPDSVAARPPVTRPAEPPAQRLLDLDGPDSRDGSSPHDS